MFKLFLCIFSIQEVTLFITCFEIFPNDFSFPFFRVEGETTEYIGLRYALLLAVYFMFSKDWKSLS